MTDENGFFKTSVASPVEKAFPFGDSKFELFGKQYIGVTDFVADLTSPDYDDQTGVPFGEIRSSLSPPVIGSQEFVNVVLMTPTPQIKAKIISAEPDIDGNIIPKFSVNGPSRAFLPGAELFVEKSESMPPGKTLDIDRFFTKGDNDAGAQATSTGKIPKGVTYTISAKGRR